jgi:hypothetical protein
MKIPKTLKIGGHTITVDCSKELEGVNGVASAAKNSIQICSTLPTSQKEATLIHEIFHFLNTTFGSQVMNHALMDSLAEQFYQVLSDNKLLR